MDSIEPTQAAPALPPLSVDVNAFMAQVGGQLLQAQAENAALHEERRLLYARIGQLEQRLAERESAE